MKEIWTDIYGFDGKYQVSTWGRVRSANGILTPYITPKGYLKVGLRKNDRAYKFRVHRLVADAFIPNWNNLPEVNHIDGNKQNNSVTNLEWASGLTNKLHDKDFEMRLMETAKTIRQMKNFLDEGSEPE